MRTSHQGVILTPWWSRWLTRDGDGEKDAPASHIDPLVVQGGRRGAEMARTTHQQVNMTRWWSKVVFQGRRWQEGATKESIQLVGDLGGRRGGGNGENNPPMSHIDLLVV